jgi:NAD(P)-dependent dehydrogenase (short-subunit alcohol dehydrogenase family)
METLSGKIALVTGAADGLGSAIATALARDLFDHRTLSYHQHINDSDQGNDYGRNERGRANEAQTR